MLCISTAKALAGAAQEVSNAHRRNRAADKCLHSNAPLLRTKRVSVATRAHFRRLSRLQSGGSAARAIYQTVAATGIPAERNQGVARHPRALLKAPRRAYDPLAKSGAHCAGTARGHRQ